VSLSKGTRIGRYEIQELLAIGGMSEIYRAHDTELDRDVVVKALPEDFASDIDRLERLRREARLLAALRHPNICTIHDLFQHDSIYGLVLELIEGPTLQDRLRRDRLALEEVLSIAAQLASALKAVHEKGFAHRDIKPSNVKLPPEGPLKLIDFGVSTEGSRRESRENESGTETVFVTRIGTVLGTGPYMSPEQTQGRPLDSKTDVWSFGCVLFEMLASEQPFKGSDETATRAAILGSEPPWHLLPADTPHAIRLLLRKCLDKNPSHRLAHIHDALLDIEEAQGGPAGPQNRPTEVLIKEILGYVPLPEPRLSESLVCLRLAFSFEQALKALEELLQEFDRRKTVGDVPSSGTLAQVAEGIVDFIKYKVGTLPPPAAGQERLLESVQSTAVRCYARLLYWWTTEDQHRVVVDTFAHWLTSRSSADREYLGIEAVKELAAPLINSMAVGPQRARAVKLLEDVIRAGYHAATPLEWRLVETTVTTLADVKLDSVTLAELLETGFQIYQNATTGSPTYRSCWARVVIDAGRNERFQPEESSKFLRTVNGYIEVIKRDPSRTPDYTMLTQVMAALQNRNWRPLNCHVPHPPISATVSLVNRADAVPMPGQIGNFRVRFAAWLPGAWFTSNQEFRNLVRVPAQLTLRVEAQELQLDCEVTGLEDAKYQQHKYGYRISLGPAHDELLGQLAKRYTVVQ